MKHTYTYLGIAALAVSTYAIIGAQAQWMENGQECHFDVAEVTCRPAPSPTPPSGGPAPYYGGGGPGGSGPGSSGPGYSGGGESGGGSPIVTGPTSGQDIVWGNVDMHWYMEPSTGSFYALPGEWGQGNHPFNARGYAWCYVPAFDNLEIYWFSNFDALETIRGACMSKAVGGANFGYVFY